LPNYISGEELMDVNVETRNGVIVLKLGGRIVGIAGGELRQVIEEQLQDAAESPKFLFDFADVSRMDSSGLGTLIGLHVSVARKGGRIGVINVSNNINNLLVIGRLITIFEHFDSENDAIAELQE
jgi:anti-sigma B factor antagonist